jgi:hypothetical protein
MLTLCTRCGTALAPRSQYCPVCGQPTNPEVATYGRRALSNLPALQIKVILRPSLSHHKKINLWIFGDWDDVTIATLIASVTEVISGEATEQVITTGGLNYAFFPGAEPWPSDYYYSNENSLFTSALTSFFVDLHERGYEVTRIVQDIQDKKFWMRMNIHDSAGSGAAFISEVVLLDLMIYGR